MAKCRCARTKVCSDKECPHMGVHDSRDTCDIECYKRGAKGIICSRIHDKPKPKLKRVKAWAYQYRDRNGDLKWYANEHKATMPVKNLPVIILIDEKYLKGKEGKK